MTLYTMQQEKLSADDTGIFGTPSFEFPDLFLDVCC